MIQEQHYMNYSYISLTYGIAIYISLTYGTAKMNTCIHVLYIVSEDFNDLTLCVTYIYVYFKV